MCLDVATHLYNTQYMSTSDGSGLKVVVPLPTFIFFLIRQRYLYFIMILLCC